MIRPTTKSTNQIASSDQEAKKRRQLRPCEVSKLKKKKESASTESYCLSANLAYQIAEKMKKWLDEFIANGFTNKECLKFVHHYERYPRSSVNRKKNNNRNKAASAHLFDYFDMKFDKIQVNDGRLVEDLNNNPMYDWNDDSSFYYKANGDEETDVEAEQLIQIHIDECSVDGSLSTVYRLSYPYPKNQELEDRMYTSMKQQIGAFQQTESESGYQIKTSEFAAKTNKRSNNYLQHLQQQSNNAPVA